MKRNRFRVLIFMLMLLLSFGHIEVKAANITNSVCYDLSSGVSQEFVIKNDLGEYEYITIEKIENNSRIADNTYKVTAEASGWTAGFYVKITNNKIMDAYSPFHSVASGTISSAALYHTSYTEARYSFKYKRTLLTYNTGVCAKIEGTNLVVSKL